MVFTVRLWLGNVRILMIFKVLGIVWIKLIGGYIFITFIEVMVLYRIIFFENKMQKIKIFIFKIWNSLKV